MPTFNDAVPVAPPSQELSSPSVTAKFNLKKYENQSGNMVLVAVPDAQFKVTITDARHDGIGTVFDAGEVEFTTDTDGLGQFQAIIGATYRIEFVDANKTMAVHIPTKLTDGQEWYIENAVV